MSLYVYGNRMYAVMHLAPKRVFSTFAIWILVVSTVLGTHQPVQAGATLTVTISEDEYDRIGMGIGMFLAEAIHAAYSMTPFGGCKADGSTDTIDLPAGEYSSIDSNPNVEDYAEGDLDILTNLTIAAQVQAPPRSARWGWATGCSISSPARTGQRSS